MRSINKLFLTILFIQDGDLILMKNKVGFFEKISSGNGFYITAAICVCVIIAAVAVIYNSSVNMLKDVLPQGTTAEVRKNQTGEKDPRVTEKVTSKAETTTVKESTTERPTNEPSRVVTTAEPTTVTFEKSKSFISPSTGEIIKGFNIAPVYDETMGDWRSHGGTDYLMSDGEEVKAVANGVVSKVISDPSWGYIVETDCGEYTVRYCGLLQGTSLKHGSVVSQGDAIGKVGSIPCESAQEIHVHLELLKDGDRVDFNSIADKK